MEIEAIIFYSFVIPCGTESTFFLHVHEMLYLNLIKSLSIHICGNLYVMKLFFKLKGGAGPDFRDPLYLQIKKKYRLELMLEYYAPNQYTK